MDFGTFKEMVRKELNTLGLRMTSVETENSNALSKLTELEREIQLLKLGNQVQKNSGGEKANSALIGNIPGATTFEIAHPGSRIISRMQGFSNHRKSSSKVTTKAMCL